MACVIYSAVFQESTVGNPYHAGIPDEEAEFFQTVASDTVLNNLDLWNITPLVSVPETSNEPTSYFLNQNYPNPVRNNTRISYSVPESLMVTISVFDVVGNLVTTLVDKYHHPGNYEIELNTSGFINGIYFYQMTTGKFNQTKTMIIN